LIVCGIVAGVLALAGGCAACGAVINTRSHPTRDSPSMTAPQAIAAPTYTSTVAPSVPTTSPGSVPFVGNPKCGESHDPSDESGTGRPPGSYLCAEKNYLHEVAGENIDVHNPMAMIKAGYDRVCAIVGPSDLDTPNLGEREEAAKKELLASGVVTASADAQAVVSAAVIQLC
jgi:hypothetical protein